MGRQANESVARPADVVRFLSQSDNRVAILAALAEDGAMDRYELESTVDATRRTVLRTLNRLAERGLVQESDEGHRLTAFGRHVHDRYRTFVDAVTFDAGLERFLRLAPGDAFGFDVARLAAGETIVATEGSSYAPLDRLLAIRADAEYVRELAPDVERRSIEQLARRVDADETFSAEICLSAAVLAAAESVPEYADAQERIVAADAVDVVVTERAIDLAVCLADGTVALGVEDADGHPVAVCVCEDPVVYEWAEARFDRYVEAASALGP